MRLYLAALFLLLATSAQAAPVPGTMSDPALEARARALQKELRCMQCQGESIDESNAPLAADLRALVRARIAAGAAAVVATNSQSIVEEVRRLTGGNGVDVVLDLVKGPGQQDLLQATRPGGTLVAAGFLDARPTPEPGETSVAIINYRGFELLADPAVVNRMAASLAGAMKRHQIAGAAVREPELATGGAAARLK